MNKSSYKEVTLEQLGQAIRNLEFETEEITIENKY